MLGNGRALNIIGGIYDQADLEFKIGADFYLNPKLGFGGTYFSNSGDVAIRGDYFITDKAYVGGKILFNDFDDVYTIEGGMRF